ncbi:MAG: hypothetical protein QM770_01815 [Tepidisphaeraceae bacterium]
MLWPLAPVHALMSFYTFTMNTGVSTFEIEGPELVRDIHRHVAERALDDMTELAALVPAECYDMNPIATFERMIGDTQYAYVPLIYGYVSYSHSGFRNTKIEFSDIPQIGYANGCRGSALGGTGIAVSARTQHAELATKLAVHLASADVQRGTYAKSGGQPAHRAAWMDEVVNRNTADFFTNTLATLDLSWIRPRFDGYIAFQQRAGEIVAECLRRQRSPIGTIDALNAAFAGAQR